jgi:UDP-N-acetylglucosamine diphosphorylase/glucosamine-1-phosphate N-acetyltransferase
MNKTENFILFDDSTRENLLPLTFTRPVAGLRIGITTLKEKWEHILGRSCSCLTVDYLSKKFPVHIEPDNFFINASVVADTSLAQTIRKLNEGEKLVSENTVIAYRSAVPQPADDTKQTKDFKEIVFKGNLQQIRHPWDLFVLNDRVLRDDYMQLTTGRKSQPLSSTNQVLGKGQVFVEEGVYCECAVLNTNTGPVYIGRNAEIMEGCNIRGPFALCEHSTLKMGAKIYGATTIGPYCKVGGEINNSIFSAYSSKAHDGFLGNAVIGEWCNLGADTNNSNLKNNYAQVKLWNYRQEKFIDTGLQFCGLIMGDHSKCGINTMFNTGTIVGVSANIFGAGFPRNFLPSFSWGGSGGYMSYKPEKALETAEIAMKRRNIELSLEDREIFHHIFRLTEKYRNF